MPGQAIFVHDSEFTKEQHHRVGISAPDEWGRIHSYCMFHNSTSSDITFNRGEVVADRSWSSGDVTAAAAIGSRQLQDTGQFASLDLRGALGLVHGGPGNGQLFQVTQVIDSNTLEIGLLTDTSGNPANGYKPGWDTALTTSSDYLLRFSGSVSKAAASDNRLRGVVQGSVTVPAGEVRYGWALQKGDGALRMDGSGTNPSIGGALRTAASGLVIGGTSGDIVGVCTLADIDNSSDIIIYGTVNIENYSMSYRMTIKDKPYSKNDQGDLIL